MRSIIFKTNTMNTLNEPCIAAAVEPQLSKPARVGGGTFHTGVPERLVIEAAQRHYEREKERESLSHEQMIYQERKRRALWDMVHGPLDLAAAAPVVDPIQAAADAASVVHLANLLDHQSALLARAMGAMKALELTASAIDESRGDLDARIPYEAWAAFVDARAALLHDVAQSPVADPAAPADALDAATIKFAHLWRDHIGKLDALVTYCPTCCQGFAAKHEMSRDEVILTCGKAAGRGESRRLLSALQTAVDHIDMEALRISHGKDAAAIDAAMAAPAASEQDALTEIVGCIDAANAEGLDDALVNNTDARLADLVQRRLLPAFYTAIAAQAAQKRGAA